MCATNKFQTTTYPGHLTWGIMWVGRGDCVWQSSWPIVYCTENRAALPMSVVWPVMSMAIWLREGFQKFLQVNCCRRKAVSAFCRIMSPFICLKTKWDSRFWSFGALGWTLNGLMIYHIALRIAYVAQLHNAK